MKAERLATGGNDKKRQMKDDFSKQPSEKPFG